MNEFLYLQNKSKLYIKLKCNNFAAVAHSLSGHQNRYESKSIGLQRKSPWLLRFERQLYAVGETASSYLNCIWLGMAKSTIICMTFVFLLFFFLFSVIFICQPTAWTPICFSNLHAKQIVVIRLGYASGYLRYLNQIANTFF